MKEKLEKEKRNEIVGINIELERYFVFLFKWFNQNIFN